MNISFKGFNANNVTFFCPTEIAPGKVIKMAGDGEVEAAANGDAVFGVNIQWRNQYAGVQLAGYVECQYSGTTPNYGFEKLCVDSNGGVKKSSDASAIAYRVLHVDTANKIIGFIL